jgi:hypothetical protein
LKITGSFKILKNEFEELSRDIRHCKFVRKSRIPKPLITRYGMKNLWKCNLLDGWRLLYFIATDEEGEIAVIVGWMSHTKYDRLFGYS